MDKEYYMEVGVYLMMRDNETEQEARARLVRLLDELDTADSHVEYQIYSEEVRDT